MCVKFDNEVMISFIFYVGFAQEAPEQRKLFDISYFFSTAPFDLPKLHSFI